MIDILKKLDLWAEKENQSRKTSGALLSAPFFIKILGQTALMEARLNFELALTMDVDAYTNAEYSIKKKFDELLNDIGKHYDFDSDKVWMPNETQYEEIFKGNLCTGFIAKYEYVLFSKALKAPQKNLDLIIQYLKDGCSENFLYLAKKYHLDLDQFL